MIVLSTGSVLGDFRIESEIGRGGMGVVYRATQVSLGRPVALKVIAGGLAGQEGFRERFVRESRLAASLDHPNVIPVYAAGEDDGVLFIAMRYVDGTDLRTLLAAEGGFDPVRAAGIVAQVASALDVAHAGGLVHRDVKPGNILVMRREDGEHVYLTDFGLTKRRESESGLTAAGEWVGTLDYVAPEQLRGEPVDGRTDLYALGCVLFEMLTGTVPFPRQDDLAKLWAHISDPPPSAAERGDVPRRLADVAKRAMQKDPADRFASAGQMARAALDAVPAADDTSLRARAALTVAPPGERRRLWLALALAAAVGLAAVAAVLFLGADDDAARPQPSAVLASEAGRVVGAPIRVGDSPTGVAVGGGFVWVANTGDDTVSRVDPETERARVTPVPVGEDPRAVSYGAGSVWVANEGDGTVSRIHPGRARPSAPPIPVGRGPSDLLAGGSSVWVALEGDRLVRISPATNTVVGPPVHVASAGSVTAGARLLWVSDALEEVIHRVDGSARAIVDSPIPIGGEPADLAVESTRVWTSVPSAGIVRRIDLRSGDPASTAIRLGGRPEHLGLAGGRLQSGLWVTNGDHESVTRIDLISGRPIGRPIRVGEDPGGVAAGTRSVWVTASGDDTVTRVEPR